MNSDQVTYSVENAALFRLIHADQLHLVRKSTLNSIPVTTVLAILCTMVAAYAGHLMLGLIWFVAYATINFVRIQLCRTSSATLASVPGLPLFLLGNPHSIHEISLRVHALLALLSGLIWACVPALCEGYTSPETLFYLTCVCGITAGSAVYGFAYSPIPICFITPPLLSVIICLIRIGDFQQETLAGAVILYLVALIRGSHISESLVRDGIILKYKATATQQALRIAHEKASAYAAEMQHQATHDGLTHLLSRRGFMEVAESMQAERVAPLCMLFMDLDGFKGINDTFGHEVGDHLLKAVARRLRSCIPHPCTLARLGGDEFVVLYALDGKLPPPEELSATIIHALTPPFNSPAAGRVGISIGIYTSDQDSINDMLVCADTALYDAKSRGRNQFRFFDEGLSLHLQMQRDVQRELAQALHEGAIDLWFQPIINIHSQTLEGFEALLRWQHPKHGLIPPPDLITAASTTGLSEMLLRFVLRKAVKLIEQLRRRQAHHLRVAINVSPKEMERLHIDEVVKEKLAQYEIPATMLEIEITEETAMNVEAVSPKLANLAKLGVSISIDDFGTGYSSLGMLHLLHASRVKIDRRFVQQLAHSRENQAVVQAVMHLGQAFQFHVVAEGVENADDLHMLLQLRCPSAQGYYFARPMMENDALAFIEQRPS
ncbi:bifunctional diguanylate cyclase/phosphodiesterase [Herbaspirillum huttiense]|uniref:putative bifunctional diguanylate cyclase/phosphodiesterase n=1 Tax=Herbaspirillum huttiense TaxID=863372 RepID=UPI0031D5639F